MALSTFSSNCWDYSFQLLQPDTTSFFNFQQTLQHDQFGFNINNSFDFPDTSYDIDPMLFQYSDEDELVYTDRTNINHLLPAYFSSPFHNMISLSPEIFPPLEDFESTHYPKRQRNDYDSSFTPNMLFGHVPEFLPEIPAPSLPEIQVPGSFSCGPEKEKKTNGVSLSVQSIAARERRRKITEKTQELTKLIPGGHRMNTAEMLQAASKYVKFLQAQAHLLQFMASIQQERKESLNTEKVQNLLASPIIQEKLYSEDKCLVPLEFVETLATDPKIQSKPIIFEGIDQLLHGRDD
ncbi:hypothetical protein Ddye_013132 [Dipteronia dyeriana]|uniref:BHLH domain-containing protein n=1 Tax=Dipteronia dyeriana TaxID=168575 RepID=A0AAE0CJC1_9ROSI|nr:hypothetical protein Ddye_013132 [Dipteronia dyeriana]